MLGAFSRHPSVSFSIHRGDDPRALLYFLHGRGQDHRCWEGWPPGRELLRILRERGLPAPTVACVSFGREWLLTGPGPHRRNGLLDRFTGEAMAGVEALTGAPELRLLWGFSMGGFNAAQLVLRRPELWSAAVLSAPALPTVGPYPARAELRGYRARTGAGWLRVRIMRRCVRPYFRGQGSRERHDPFLLARRARGLPPILIECGDCDRYGFFEGARRLYEALAGAGHPVWFRAARGRGHHCVDPARVAGFLAGASRARRRVFTSPSWPAPPQGS